MIPNIFISSTIKDLKYLRDSIRKTIEEIGYNPIMSDYGEIGYLPSYSVEESCYIAVRDCQLAIFIIGKQYGSIGKNGLAITHNEYLEAKENKIPIIFLIDKDVLIMQKVFEKNTSIEINLPEVDKPKQLFSLIEEFKNSEINNGFLTFTEATNISRLLKNQLALIFGELLKLKTDSEQSNLKEIHKEISTIKHYILSTNKEEAKYADIKIFSLFFEFLQEKRNYALKSALFSLFGSFEEIFIAVSKSDDFNDLVTKNNIEYKIDDKEVTGDKSSLGHTIKFGFNGICIVDETAYVDKEILEKHESMLGLFWSDKMKIKTNTKGNSYLLNSYKALKEFIYISKD